MSEFKFAALTLIEATAPASNEAASAASISARRKTPGPAPVTATQTSTAVLPAQSLAPTQGEVVDLACAEPPAAGIGKRTAVITSPGSRAVSNNPVKKP